MLRPSQVLSKKNSGQHQKKIADPSSHFHHVDLATQAIILLLWDTGFMQEDLMAKENTIINQLAGNMNHYFSFTERNYPVKLGTQMHPLRPGLLHERSGYLRSSKDRLILREEP